MEKKGDVKKKLFKEYWPPINTVLLLFLVFNIIGILFVIKEILFLSIIPAVFLILSIMIDIPNDVNVERRVNKTLCRVGEELIITTKITIKKGVGRVVVYEKLPESFELLKGTNVHVFFKGWGILQREYSYTVRPAVKGEYLIANPKIESIQIFDMKRKCLEIGGKLKIIALPLVYPLRNIRVPPTKSPIYVPLTSVSRRGLLTTEFREIRSYTYGDPIKIINWKATARSLSEIPLVNEYEREGKKTIFIFIDATRYMNVGTTLKNAAEYAIAATASLAYYFIKRGFNVGVYVLGYKMFIRPSSGSRHFQYLVRKLTKVKGGRGYENIVKILKRYERYFIEYTPLVFFISNLSSRNWMDVRLFISFYSSLIKRSPSRGFLPIIFIDVNPYVSIGYKTRYQREFLELIMLEKEVFRKKLHSFRVYCFSWDLSKQSFANIMNIVSRMIR